MSKRYFDSIRPYRKTRSLHLLRRFSEPILRRYTKSPDFIYLEDIPDEPVLFVSNHATHFGTYVMNIHLKRNKSLWASSTLFYIKSSSNHSMVYWYPNARGIKRLICRATTYFLALIMPFVYRSYEAIPVYLMSLRIRETYRKSVETLIAGKDLVIFPESRFKSENYTFTNQFQNGYLRFAPDYYAKTGKKLKIYPAYCCRDLDKVVIGRHYEYNPDIHIKEQSLIVNDYLQKSIDDMANNLPEHSIAPYNRDIVDIEYIKRKYKGII